MAPRRANEEVRKEKCRNKEARRAEQINGAFNRLLGSIPYITDSQRTTMPKIKTLRLAMKYIQHLNQLLDGQWAFDNNACGSGSGGDAPRPLQFDDFRYIADGEIKVRNSYRERAQKTEMDSETVHRIQQRNEMKRQQRCSDRAPAPRHQSEPIQTTVLVQPTYSTPPLQFDYIGSSSSSTTPPMLQYTGDYTNLQYSSSSSSSMSAPLPRVDTVYGSCSPPEFMF